MSSIRKLKKDIDLLVFEVISDCFTFGTLHPDNQADEVSGIISDAVTLRNDLIHRVNNREGNADPKAVRLHYRLIEKDLFAETDKLCSRLSALHANQK
ncbi:MAG TPA: hypothetical protein PLX08_03260 [Bacteroidales bacterium]|nr:hypothetical protein [Bacteroidales bacterium]